MPMRRFKFAIPIAVLTLFVFLSSALGDVLMKEVMTREYSIQVGRTELNEIKEIISREVSLFIGENLSPYNQIISREASVVVTSNVPPSPINDLSINISPTGEKVIIDWSHYNQWAEKDIDHFDIYYTEQGPFSVVTEEGFSVTSVRAESTVKTIDNLPAFTDHYFAVVPVDALGYYYTNVTYSAGYVLSPEVVSREVSLFIGEDASPNNQVISREASFVVVSNVPPAPITDLMIEVSPTGEIVTIDWSHYNQWAEKDIDHFDIYYTAQGTFSSVTEEGLSVTSVRAESTSKTFENLPAFTDHYFTVVPVDELCKASHNSSYVKLNIM